MPRTGSYLGKRDHNIDADAFLFIGGHMPESLLQRLRRLIERDILEVEDLLALEIASQMHSLLVGAVMVIGTISPKAHIILDTQACEEEDVVHGTFFRDVLQETGDISDSGLFL